jgi:hypothetical protein
MYLSKIVLTSDGSAAKPKQAATIIIRRLWAAAAANEMLQHVSVRQTPCRIDIGIFTSAPTVAAASAFSRQLVDHALSAGLPGWRLELTPVYAEAVPASRALRTRPAGPPPA